MFSARPQDHADLRPEPLHSRVANALTSALARPYGGARDMGTSGRPSTYLQSQSPGTLPGSGSRRTQQGYSLSSTYVSTLMPAYLPLEEVETTASPRPRRASASAGHPPPQNNSWFTPGNHHCTHPGCKFKASMQSVETHMMDRHLIFPKDWDKRAPQQTWDGDLSLKGKPVHVVGTSILLDTPESIGAWLAERRKRWPSAGRVASKKQREQEAIERGEIQMGSLLNRMKRKREEPHPAQRPLPLSYRNDRTNAKVLTHTARETERVGQSIQPEKVKSSDSSSSDDSGPEEMPTSTTTQGAENCNTIDLSTRPLPPRRRANVERDQVIPSNRHHRPTGTLRTIPKSGILGESRSLLRNLLLPEIRHTVSDLSQVIHFLVENDFFDGYELNPGDADTLLVQETWTK